MRNVRGIRPRGSYYPLCQLNHFCPGSFLEGGNFSFRVIMLFPATSDQDASAYLICWGDNLSIFRSNPFRASFATLISISLGKSSTFDLISESSFRWRTR